MMATAEKLEQAREALFSLEQLNAAQRRRINQLQAVNALLQRLGTDKAGIDVYGEMFAAAGELLAFDEALVMIAEDGADLKVRAATPGSERRLCDSPVVRKALAGRTLVTTGSHVFAEPEALAASILCLPFNSQSRPGLILLVRRVGAEPFDHGDIVTGQQLAPLVTQGLALKAAQQAKAESHAKSAFLATMSHELRTPLNGIIGMTSILDDGRLSDEQRHCIQTIENCGNALLQLIDDILEFSRIDAGALSLSMARVETRALLAEAASIVGPRASQKNLALEVCIEPGAPEALQTDGRRVQQVVLNLASNAVKFTEQGRVVLRARMSGTSNLPRLRIEVIDTGIGIPAEAQSRLFQDFTQVDDSISRRFGGTGLGLAISKRLVERLGGRIGCDSSPGQGSTFWCELPVGETEMAAPMREADISAPWSAHPLSILVAEDNTVNQTVIRMLLEKMGHAVAIACNGIEVLEACQGKRFDLVFMDMQMPIMDGLETTRRLRASDGSAELLPVIALTANAFDSDRDACLAAGMSGYVAKPVNRRKLEDAMSQVLAPMPLARIA